MSESPYAVRLDEIQAKTHALLREHGFKKRGRTFNRLLGTGIIHVVNFEMGQYLSSLYGQFTVNLGVFIPEVFTAVTGNRVPSFVQEYDCEIRKRLGRLLPTPGDKWWDLDQPDEGLGSQMSELLHTYALPFLDRFESGEDIVSEWEARGNTIGLPPRAALSIAILLAARGERQRASELLRDEYARKKGEPYSVLVKRVGLEMGLLLDDAL